MVELKSVKVIHLLMASVEVHGLKVLGRLVWRSVAPA